MDKIVSYTDNTIIVRYQLDEQEIEILKTIKKDGYVEFRDRTNEEEICDRLFETGLLQEEDDAWHKTYMLNELSEGFLSSIAELNNDEPTISIPVKMLFDKDKWSRYCEMKHINEWAVAEGLMDTNDKVELTISEAKELGLI